MYQNYKQALDIINNLMPVVEELKTQLKITDTDFEHWNLEELEYLQTLLIEQEYDSQKIVYVEALQSLTQARYVFHNIRFLPADKVSGLCMEVSLRSSFYYIFLQISHNTLVFEKKLKS